MSVIVKASDVASELTAAINEMTIYLDKRTGEFIYIPDEDVDAIERGSDFLVFDPDPETLLRMKEALTSDDYVALPSKFDIHEWAIMKRFAESLDDVDAAQELLDAIHGSGAFRWFNKMIDRHGIRKDWYAFRDKALEEIAIEWLEAEEIAYE